MMKAPEIGEPESCSPVRKREKRTFGVECRYIGPKVDGFFDFMKSHREWHHFRSYRTEKDRQKAIDCLNKNKAGYWKWEHRAVD